MHHRESTKLAAVQFLIKHIGIVKKKEKIGGREESFERGQSKVLNLKCYKLLRGHIDKFCLQVHNFGNNEDKQMILTPNERSFYLAPDDISFFNIITVPFDTEPPPTDDLLDAVSEEVSSLISAPRKNSILHIFVCLVTVTLEVILEFWKKEEIARSKIWAIRRVR